MKDLEKQIEDQEKLIGKLRDELKRALDEINKLKGK